MKLLMILAASAALATATSKEGVPINATMMTHCTLKENGTVSINVSGSNKDAAVVRDTLDAKIAEINTLAKDQNFSRFELQSSNYTVNSNYNDDVGERLYQYTGNFSFSVQPADKALDFMVLLTKKGYHAYASVNSYRNGGCNQ